MRGGFLLYHVTSMRVASEVMEAGFVDGEGSYMSPGSTLKGVFLSNRALLGPFPHGVVLEVCFSIPIGRLNEFEVVDEDLEYREWCVPANFIKRWAEVRLADVTTPDDFLDPVIGRGAEIARLRSVKGSGEPRTSNLAIDENDGIDWSEPQLREVKASRRRFLPPSEYDRDIPCEAREIDDLRSPFTSRPEERRRERR